MRTLLRRVSSGLYFQQADQWTPDAEQAHNFRSIDRALEFVRTWKLRGVELAFAFHDSDNITTASVEKTSASADYLEA
jgi:hypothetical protein